MSVPRASDHHGAGCQPTGEAKPFPPPSVPSCKKCNQPFERQGTPGQFDYYFCKECVEVAISDWQKAMAIFERVGGED